MPDSNTIIYTVLWLIPFLIYLFAFTDSPNMRIVWSIVTLVFTWPGLIVRFVYGLIAANSGAKLP